MSWKTALVHDLFTQDEQETLACCLRCFEGMTLQKYDDTKTAFQCKVRKHEDEVIQIMVKRIDPVIYQLKCNKDRKRFVLSALCNSFVVEEIKNTDSGKNVIHAERISPDEVRVSYQATTSVPVTTPALAITTTPKQVGVDVLVWDVLTREEQDMVSYHINALSLYVSLRDYCFVGWGAKVEKRVREIITMLALDVTRTPRCTLDYAVVLVSEMEGVTYGHSMSVPENTDNTHAWAHKVATGVNVCIPLRLDLPSLPTPTSTPPPTPTLVDRLYGINLSFDEKQDTSVHTINLCMRGLYDCDIRDIWELISKIVLDTNGNDVVILLDANNFSPDFDFEDDTFLCLVGVTQVKYITMRHQTNITVDHIMSLTLDKQIQNKLIFMDKAQVHLPNTWMPEHIQNIFTTHAKYYKMM